jgi:hypothetical protein
MQIETLSQAVILTLTALAMIFFVGFPISSDFRAVWLAGEFFGDGMDPSRIYAGSEALFTMEPPRAWIDQTLDAGMEIGVYPFIYPPLWAWVSAQLVPLTTFAQAVPVVTVLNLLMLLAMPLLARRILGPTMSGTLYALLLFPLYAFTFPFLLPLEENQPQILVSFLLLFAIERTQNGGAIWGGAILALAASIKLYPALFALFWLFGGERRALASFVIFGGGLGLTSIAIAGWPMHAAFLAEVSAISKSALYSSASYSIDPFIAKFGFANELTIVTTAETGGDAKWKVVEKTTLWRVVNGVAFFGVLAGLCRLSARGGLNNAFFWPAAFLLIGLVSPLTWIYHLIPAFVFLPALLTRYRVLPVLCLYALFVVLLRTASMFGQFGMIISLPGTHELVFAALILLAGVYLFVATAPSDPPLRTGSQSL